MSSKADWRLRFGLVGVQGKNVIVRRGDLLGSVSTQAIDGKALYDILQGLGKRFCYQDLLAAFQARLPEKEALQVIGYLKNEAGVIAAPLPDVPEDELFISDSTGGFLNPNDYRQFDLLLIAGSVEHRDELSTIVQTVFGRPPKTANASASTPIQADAAMLCTQGLDSQTIADIEARLERQGNPWFSVADYGGSARAGPFNSVPQKRSVCRSCLGQRISAAVLPISPGIGAVSRHFTMAAILGIHQLIRLVAAPNLDRVFANQTFSISADLQIHTWRIAPMSGCARCGTNRSEITPPRGRKPKRVADMYADAELRDYRWQTALDRFRALVGPLDVIQAVREVKHPNVTGIPTSAATVSTPGVMSDTPQARSFIGVGCDGELAELASLARAMERLSLCQTHTDLGTTASAKELGPESLAPSRWGPELAHFDQVAMQWTNACSLVDAGSILVPSRSVFYPYHPVSGEEQVHWAPHPSGTGCDHSYDGALLWALLELVEADTMARVDAYRISGQAVDMSAHNADQQTTQLLQAIRACGYDAVIRDCSLDLGIPVVAAVVVAEGSSKCVSRGTCAHPCGAFAIRHALREAVRRMFRPHNGAMNCGHLLETPDNSRLARVPDLSRGSVHDDLEHVLTLLRRVSSSLCAVDLTRPLSPGGRDLKNRIYCVRAIATELIGPMSPPSNPRLLELDPGGNPISCSTAQTGFGIGPSTTEDCPVIEEHIFPTHGPVPEPHPALGEKLIFTLGKGVLADLVHDRLRSLGKGVVSYFEAERLLQDLDNGRSRPGMVVAALGEMPASVIRNWNAEAFTRALPWIAFTQRGDDVECGPLVRAAPHRGCYWCMRLHAYSQNANLAAWERNNELIPDSAGGIFHAGARLAVECILGEVALFFSGSTRSDLTVRRFGPNEVVCGEQYSPVSDCPVCGSVAGRPILR